MTFEAAVGIDVGGTKILAGLVDTAGRVLDGRRWPTRREHYLDDVLRAAEAGLAMAAGRDVECRQVWGTPERIAQEFAPLAKLFAERNGSFSAS